MEYLDSKDLVRIFSIIKNSMKENKDWLIELDAQNGDGDLGLSMDSGFSQVYDVLSDTKEENLGKLMLKASRTINEAAPSTLGTLLSIGFMGMAKYLKEMSQVSLKELANSVEKGLDAIMEKGGARPGEKTILDSLYPAMLELKKAAEKGVTMKEALEKAVDGAKEGMIRTKDMKSVHGRAAYYAETSLGIQDGGATVGMLLIKSLFDYVNN